ncbi:DEAD/DEAH box helicase [Paenibacillus hunanensis]|uniref:Single-stranded DNA-binding protein n=1 Tax=Paenibacillus hunanensis TaxID=539262 RepID=A0ABU1J1N7_9BACL|nr:DEAD/DEAH box helicase [Paenibacillus hunanensis]MDR6244882.1 single-stranded DNA-binding protein [Paenibacillus hunanensis]GGJ04879.1 helicase SNF [Paenibacillus hunanensis]
MSYSIQTQSIQRLCGSTSYHKGMTMYRAGKVGFTRYDDESGEYEAVVQSRRGEVEHVQIRVSEEQQIQASCSCPSLASYRYHCQHIAAVLIYIHECEQRGEPPLLIAPTAAVSPQGSRSQRNTADATSRQQYASSSKATDRTSKSHSSADEVTTYPASHAEQDRYAQEEQLTNELLHLFTEAPRRAAVRRRYLETRDALALDVICHPLASGNGQYRIGIELRMGLTRTFIVRHIRRLLDSIRRGESYHVTARFAYDPELHSFAAGDDRVLRQLIQIAEDELPAESAATRNQPGRQGERMLSVPVSHWSTLVSALRQCRSVYVAQQDGKELPIIWSSNMLPLQFELDQSELPSLSLKSDSKLHEQHYVLRVQGLQPLIVLEAYEAVLNGAELVELDGELCRRLGGLQRLLRQTALLEDEQQLHVSATQLEPFVRQVVPELMKLGNVHLTRSVSNRVTQTPLQARLYLDRVRDRLLAGLEFQYGSLIINPLELEQEGQDEDRIVLRDGEREAQILQLMEEADFTVTEGGYFLTDEDAEYTFLYHIVPRLEKLLQVYATSIVKAMLQNPLSPPKLTVKTDQRHDWLEIRFALDGIPESEILQVLASLQEQRRYHRLPSGAFLPLEDQAFRQIADFIRRTGMAAPGTGTQDEQEGVLFRLPVLYGLEQLDRRDENEAIRFDRSLRRLLESMEQPERQHEAVPATLDSVLRDYQHEGYQWMRTLARYGFGGILADDMGLGKTLQSIAFIVSMQSELRRSGRPVLVITPASLMYNWQYELQRFAPELRVLLVDGNKAERTARWQQVLAQEPDMEAMSISTEQATSSAAKESIVQPIDVVITSYPLLRQDRELATSHAYHTLILDEAQNVKNALTHAARAVKDIQAKHRFALTGTPIENSLQELWSIMSIVMPGLLGTRREFNDLLPDTIARRVSPFILRRMKTDVLHELPDKQEITLVSELLPEQKVLYAAYLAQLQQDALKHLYDPDQSEQKIRIFAGLTRLRQLCCDPGLFVEDYAGGSGKLEQLLELVQDYRDSGRRMLVFSQFTGMLKRIGKQLQERHIPFFYLDGSTASAERLELCNRFNAGEKEVFLISLKAGGTGLNLTGADTVILYDLWWNPAVEEQAADRAYRMGQQRKVQVIRLITRGTVEEKVLELQHSKRELVSEIIQPGQAQLSSLTEQDIRELLLL